MEQLPAIPEDLKKLIQQVGAPVRPEDVELYGKLRRIHDQSEWIRAVVKAWTGQQVQDRQMRRRYATYLLSAMGVQALAVNVIYVLMGCGVLSYQEWTAKTFIMSVFAEIAALVLLIVKYLFRPANDKVLDIVEEAKKGL